MIRLIKPKLLVLTVVSALLLGACQMISPSTQEPTAIPTVVGEEGVVVQGNLVPVEYVSLSFNMGGTISKVFVNEGDTIQAGQVIAQLDQRERLAATVASADLELVNASQALKKLNENADVNTAAAQQRVADARDAVRSAERYLNNLNSGSRQTDIDSAKANVVLLKDRLDKANKDFASYENKPEDNVTRAQLLSKLADTQRKYDDAVRLLNNLQGTASDIDLAVAQANLSLAQANLTMAEKDYEDVKTGPNPDDLEVAQARLKAAETAQQAARKALADSELVAPMNGTVVSLDLKYGEQAIPGKVAVVLADLSHWKVETDDLNEMEIPKIQVNQPVTVTPDALPELELSGKVESISQVSIEKYGNVTYTAKIDLTKNDPRLRWGMTVTVHFK